MECKVQPLTVKEAIRVCTMYLFFALLIVTQKTSSSSTISSTVKIMALWVGKWNLFLIYDVCGGEEKERERKRHSTNI